jgi:hypothetical protein
MQRAVFGTNSSLAVGLRKIAEFFNRWPELDLVRTAQ